MNKLAFFNTFLVVFFIVAFVIIVALGKALRSSIFLRKQLPLFVCFLMGVIMICQFFIPSENPLYKNIDDFSTKWVQIITSFSLVIGLVSLVTINLSKFSRGAEDWFYSLVLLVGFFITSIIGLREGLEGKNFSFIFDYMYTPMQSTMFSILAFFVASAAFRAFRARTREATLLLVAAIVVMLGRVELGSVLWSYIPVIGKIEWLDVSYISQWINDVFTTAGQRAILLGASLGYIAASFKILLGIEKSYLGSEE